MVQNFFLAMISILTLGKAPYTPIPPIKEKIIKENKENGLG